MDSGCIPVELICIPVDSSGFRWNPVIPAGMVGGVTSTETHWQAVLPILQIKSQEKIGFSHVVPPFKLSSI